MTGGCGRQVDEPLSNSTGAHISARTARCGLLSISRWQRKVPERHCYVVISTVRSAFGPLAPKLFSPILRRGLVLGLGRLLHLADVFSTRTDISAPRFLLVYLGRTLSF